MSDESSTRDWKSMIWKPPTPEAQRAAKLAKLQPIQIPADGIGLKRPDELQWVRVCPNPETRLRVMVRQEQGWSDTYRIVTRDRWWNTDGNIHIAELVLTVDWDANLSFWPLRQRERNVGFDHNRWHESEIDCAKLAQTEWIRMMSTYHKHGFAGEWEAFTTEFSKARDDPDWSVLEAAGLNTILGLIPRWKLIGAPSGGIHCNP